MTAEFTALWDTGATISAVTRQVVETFDLKSIGKIEVDGVHGPELADTYLIGLWLPHGVVFPEVRVIEGKLRGAEIIIGMDIIGTGDLVVTNFDGRTHFSFQSPSQGHMDFVEPEPTEPTNRQQRRQRERQDRKRRGSR